MVECSGPSDPRSVLVAFHGYAQNPGVVLSRFEEAGITERHLVVAPWGPHQFYDRQGEVVASWMTRHRRERQVQLLLQHAKLLWSSLVESGHEKLPLDLFGFSQGGAQAYRVGMLAGLPVRTIFVLAGDLPPECRAHLKSRPHGPPVLQLWGRQDRRVPLAVRERDQEALALAGYPHDAALADGGHELLDALLRRVAEELSGDI